MSPDAGAAGPFALTQPTASSDRAIGRRLPARRLKVARSLLAARGARLGVSQLTEHEALSAVPPAILDAMGAKPRFVERLEPNAAQALSDAVRAPLPADALERVETLLRIVDRGPAALERVLAETGAALYPEQALSLVDGREIKAMIAALGFDPRPYAARALQAGHAMDEAAETPAASGLGRRIWSRVAGAALSLQHGGLGDVTHGLGDGVAGTGAGAAAADAIKAEGRAALAAFAAHHPAPFGHWIADLSPAPPEAARPLRPATTPARESRRRRAVSAALAAASLVEGGAG